MKLTREPFLASTRPVLVFSSPATHSEQTLNDKLQKIQHSSKRFNRILSDFFRNVKSPMVVNRIPQYLNKVNENFH
jgi:hypothetical protein